MRTANTRKRSDKSYSAVLKISAEKAGKIGTRSTTETIGSKMVDAVVTKQQNKQGKLPTLQKPPPQAKQPTVVITKPTQPSSTRAASRLVEGKRGQGRPQGSKNVRKSTVDLKGQASSSLSVPIGSPILTKAFGNLHNKDDCGNCRQGGSLICCERCPEAFHFLCCVPPLDPDKLPDEEWLCNQCNPRKLGPAVFSKRKPTDQIWRGIAERFSRMNPTAFELPKAISDKFNPPPTALTFARNIVHEITCFHCGREVTDKTKSPQPLKCSVCPLVFHIDCLPGVTPHVHAPSKWLCPNHPEHIQARRKLNGVPTKSLTLPTTDNSATDGNVMLAFISKVQKERDLRKKNEIALVAERMKQPLSEPEKSIFLSALLGFQSDWWHYHFAEANKTNQTNSDGNNTTNNATTNATTTNHKHNGNANHNHNHDAADADDDKANQTQRHQPQRQHQRRRHHHHQQQQPPPRQQQQQQQQQPQQQPVTKEQHTIVYPEISECVATSLDVDMMSQDQMKATILHLRREKLNSRKRTCYDIDTPSSTTNTTTTLSISPSPSSSSLWGTSGRMKLKHDWENHFAVLRAIHTGEIFEVPNKKSFVFGTNQQGSTTKCDLDVAPLKPPEAVETSHAALFYNNDTDMFELLNLSEKGSVWLNGVEVLSNHGYGRVVANNNSVIEIAGVQFLFWRPYRTTNGDVDGVVDVDGDVHGVDDVVDGNVAVDTDVDANGVVGC